MYTLPILVWNRVWVPRELRECMNVFIVSIPNEKENYANSKWIDLNNFLPSNLIINNIIYYPSITLSTSPLLFVSLFVFFILIFQINYCGGDVLFFRMQIVFPTKTMNCNGRLVWACLYKRLVVLKTGRGVSPYNGLYGEAPPERGTFFRLQKYEREEISLVEVYKKVGKSVIWVCEIVKGPKGLIDEFYGFI